MLNSLSSEVLLLQSSRIGRGSLHAQDNHFSRWRRCKYNLLPCMVTLHNPHLFQTRRSWPRCHKWQRTPQESCPRPCSRCCARSRRPLRSIRSQAPPVWALGVEEVESELLYLLSSEVESELLSLLSSEVLLAPWFHKYSGNTPSSQPILCRRSTKPFPRLHHATCTRCRSSCHI